MAYTESLSFDQKLWPFDVDASVAHVQMLGEVGVLSHDDVATIVGGLESIRAEFTSGSFVFEPGDEDIHTAIERRLTQLVGDAGAKVHTGRSRNDQVVTAMRLWCKHHIEIIHSRVLALVDVLIARADDAGWGIDGTYLPGYTHVQRAQPVLLAHHFAAHAWALLRDAERLRQTRTRLDVSPLGAGALAGSSLPLDPSITSRTLGFSSTFANSLDAVSDRDFVAEFLFDLALMGTHLSRIGEEWVLWTSEEFAFARLSDQYSTGSSMLPQKKNADIAELARGKSGRLIGNLTTLLVVLKGLPLAYNRDLQEDKEPLFDSVNQVTLALGALGGMIATATINTGAMQSAADAEVLVATDLAEFLVARGMPFRHAHAIVGTLVRESLSGDATLRELCVAHPEFGEDALPLFATGEAVRRRRSPGAAGPHAAVEQRSRLLAERDKQGEL